jgi:hypothetical protein
MEISRISVLLINDSLTSKYFQMTNGATAGYVLQSDAAGNGTWVAPSSSLPTAGTGLSYSSTTLNSVWTQSGNNIYNNNTAYVGVGTASPAYQLDVATGSGQYATAIHVQPSTGGASYRAAILLDDWLLEQDLYGTKYKNFSSLSIQYRFTASW